MEIMDGASEVAGALLIRPTPGHTQGHVAIQLSANGAEALFTGDLMHSPLQV
jgi:glyoxylase-like metal-dependent hydrolase (beta-lactamase superfamily II)